jgi:DNA-binding GntR family transcriptional regulator
MIGKYKLKTKSAFTHRKLEMTLAREPTMQSGADSTYQLLKRRLVAGHYLPGTRLKEEHLAREFGLSRTPIRAALKRLVSDRLATEDRGHGVHVAAWSEWDVEECFQLRMLLEPYAACLAAQRRSAVQLVALCRTNDQMAEAILGGADKVSLIQVANRVFHQTILEACGSERVQGLLATMIDMPIITRSFHLHDRQDFERSLQHHRDLALAVQDGDGELAHEVMQLHLRMSYHRFMQRREQYRTST